MLKRFLIALLSLFVLCGCSNKYQQNILTFTSWGSITEVKILKQLISNFEKENPSVKINFIHIPQNYFQKLHLLFASNSAPDVLFINNLYLPIYASYLDDLTTLVDKKDYYTQSLDSLSWNNKLLAIPRDVSNLIFYVNTDIVEYNEKWTMSDLLSIMQKITSDEVYAISFEEDIYWAFPYLAYFGEKFNEKFDYRTSKGFNFYKDLRDKYRVAPTKSQVGSSTQAQMFLDKKIGIYLSGRWMYPKITEKADFNWNIVAFPLGKNPYPCDASGWAISKKSKNKDLAIKFVKYLSDEKSSKYFAQTGLIVPARKDVSQLLNNLYHNEKVFLEVIDNSEKTYIPYNFKKLSDDFNNKAFN